MDTYLPFVGFVQFPRRPSDLSSRVCPACLVDRVGMTCASCGFDLISPLIAELDSASMDVSAALDRRLELIGRVRHASAAEVALEQAAQSAPAAVPVLGAAVAPAPAVAPTLVASAVAPVPIVPVTGAAAAEPRRHLGVQVVLLIVGVSLLSIGAIFFLVYAFITFGLVWRSVIILAVTVAAIVGATLLKRRKLTATAEAIAALGIVFVYLDIFAVRANNVFAAGSSDGLMYWGIALLVSSIAFTAWSRVSELRLPGIVAFSTFAPALALLIGGATAQLDDGIRVFSSFAALAIGGLVHPLGHYRAEKVVVAAFGIAGLVLAGLSAPFMPGDDWIPGIELALVAIIALAQVAVIARVATPVVVGRIAAALGAVAAASALLVVAPRVSDPGFIALWPVVGAAIVALTLEFVFRTLPSSLAKSFARVAGWSAAAVGALCLLITAGLALVPSLSLADGMVPRWVSPGSATVTVSGTAAAAILAILVVLVLISAAWAAAGTLDERLPTVLAGGCAVLLLAVPMLGMLWAAVIAWLLIAAAGVVSLGFARRRGWSPGIRVTLAATTVIAVTLAYSSSWASIDTWWFGSVGAVAILVASRVASPAPALRAVTLAVAVILALVAAGAEGWHINELFMNGAAAGLESIHTTAALAIVLVGASALLSRRVSSIETSVLFWIPLAVFVVAVALGRVQFWFYARPDLLVVPDTFALLVLGAVALLALTLWVVGGIGARLRIERVAASILMAPAAALTLESLARLLALPASLVSATGVTAALAVAAIALGTGLSRGQKSARRRQLDIGAGVVVTFSVLTTVIMTRVNGAPDEGWLVLVIAAVTALVLAVSPDGLFSSTSPRKHVGWIALGLATFGFWLALMQNRLLDVELFVLPVGGTLLLIALFSWRASRSAEVSAAAAPFLALAGLLVAILPLATVAITGSTLRVAIIVSSCAALLLASSIPRRAGVFRPYLDVAAIAGAAGLTIAGFGRPALSARLGLGDATTLDLWVSITVVALMGAVVLQSRITDETSRRRRLEAAQVIVVLAMAGLLVIELSVLGNPTLGTVRAITLLLFFATLHVVGLITARVPFGTVTGWIALLGAAITAITAVAVGAIDPFEWTTIILAAALLIVGAITLRRDMDSGSWPWLAPGILVLLIPSLLATFTDAPIWRLVALGVASVIVIVVGALARLQAPLILGSAVVLIHALRTFAPQLVAVYQLTEWWVWAVIGGAIILFVALTLEKRVRDVKVVGSRVSALR